MGLQLGDEVECPRCHRWHAVEQPNAAETTAAQHFLYVRCRGALYFVGQLGTESRWPSRRPEGKNA